MKLLLNVLALAALTCGVLITVAASSGHARALAAGNTAPTLGCQRIWPQQKYLVEKCGDCTVFDLGTASARNLLLESAAVNDDSEWLDIGPTWVARPDSDSFDGAARCRDRLGGSLVLN